MWKQILFTAILAAWTNVASAQEWGDLTGTFVIKGAAPTPAKINVDKDPQFCGPHNLVDEDVVVNKENGGLANVVVYLNDTDPSTNKWIKPKIHPDYDKEAKAEIVVDNQNCRFEPHVLGIRTGQTLVIGNKDPIGHNTKADFFGNTPFNDLIPAGSSLKKTFAKPEATPSDLTCSIHPWMKARLLIREDPYFAVSDKDGKFTIKNLPAGEHTFVVWSNKFILSPTVGGKAATWARGRVKMNIKAGANSLGKVEVTPESLVSK